MMLVVVVGVTLTACSHNAPAPVFDATLAQRVKQGLKQNREPQAKPISVSRVARLSQANISRTSLGSEVGTVIEVGTAISSVPTSQPIKKAEHKFSNLSNQYKVQAGDTLYSIAWQHSLDPKELARINGIKSGVIYPSQQLNLKAKNGVKPSPVYNKLALVASLDREFLNQKTTPTKSKQQKTQFKSQHIKAAANPPLMMNDSVKHWIWPVNGTVIRPFSNSPDSRRSNNNKGVDIAAKHGASVRATANGKVVYSGSGLRGYGQLVIIKHNELFLSAYAHNDKLHVKENEFVKAGQKIADLGRSDSDQDKLHFEIRYKGKPVDPLNYLPEPG